jgi:hypothetical protein
MADKLNINLKADHIGGGFEWEREPRCCDLFRDAVEENKIVFVSNFSDSGNNLFYMMPVDADGELFKGDGVGISFCPWCGTKITGHKKYPQNV